MYGGMQTSLAKLARHQEFAYDATEPKGRRKPPTVRYGSEDDLLDSARRSKLTANSRDIHRNFAIAAWMVRKHLDYVASFSFHCRSGNVDFDAKVEQFVSEWSRPYNCDASGRHRLLRMIRLAEARRTLDGDVGLLKLTNGSMQAIEEDRIRQPSGEPADQGQTRWVHGVRINQAGRALAYAIHRRRPRGGGFELERVVSARNLVMLGYYDRFDQVRGISPIASALNPLRDVYENFDYALIKAKVTQLFALAIFSDGMRDGGVVTDNEDSEDSGASRYSVDFGRGPVKLELDPGDKAEFLESRHPATEFQSFTKLVIAVAMKALDLPYSFYDESHTNFFGSRAAWLHYDRSCMSKRDDLLELLNRITIWRLGLALLDGELVLPRGWSLGNVPFEWVPTGMPWWDPSKEINGDLQALGAGLDNPQRITKERGRGDWYDNIDRIAEAMKYAEGKGVPVSFAPTVQPIEVVEANGDAN